MNSYFYQECIPYFNMNSNYLYFILSKLDNSHTILFHQFSKALTASLRQINFVFCSFVCTSDWITSNDSSPHYSLFSIIDSTTHLKRNLFANLFVLLLLSLFIHGHLYWNLLCDCDLSTSMSIELAISECLTIHACAQKERERKINRWRR